MWTARGRCPTQHRQRAAATAAIAATAAMDPEARRRACVELRAKLSRDTGTNLTTATCEQLLRKTFRPAGGGERVSLQSDPGQFYACLGGAIAAQTLGVVLPNHLRQGSRRLLSSTSATFVTNTTQGTQPASVSSLNRC
jgi:hypothetical protein